MTDMSKSPVTRRSTVKWKGRRIYITLRADDQIEFRLERVRDKFTLPVQDAYRLAEQAAIRTVIPGRS
jgi:hypothetical protein